MNVWYHKYKEKFSFAFDLEFNHKKGNNQQALSPNFDASTSMQRNFCKRGLWVQFPLLIYVILKGVVNRLTCMIWSVFWTMNICHNKPLSISSPSLGMVISVQITHYIPANYASRYDIAKYDREPVSIIRHPKYSEIHRQKLQTKGLDK